MNLRLLQLDAVENLHWHSGEGARLAFPNSFGTVFEPRCCRFWHFINGAYPGWRILGILGCVSWFRACVIVHLIKPPDIAQ
jgi:hypothetical protein